jgi:hypothetical protein
MHVGIVELMDKGHIVLAETLCKVFCSDPQNKVKFFTLEIYADNLSFLCEKYPNLSIIVKPVQQKKEEFLQVIGSVFLDRIYIVTLTHLFQAVSRWQGNARLFLVIHNLDEWFCISLFQGIRKYFITIFHNPQLDLLLYYFKVHFIYVIYKKIILKNLRKKNGGVVVLSESIRKEIKRYNINIPVEVIPFSVFDPSLVVDEPSPIKQLRICVPGILSQYRRDYHALLEIIEKQLAPYKNQFIIDFLGGIYFDNPYADSKLIIDKINKLNIEGFSIIVHNVQFIPALEYDQELSKADIILGNINVVLSKFSEYGKTKETGIPFTMIKAGKPGILPENYQMPEELTSSTLLYHDSPDLARILIALIKDLQLLNDLKKNAIENAKHFSPEVIYNQLIADKK